jgi:hypothetical protein
LANGSISRVGLEASGSLKLVLTSLEKVRVAGQYQIRILREHLKIEMALLANIREKLQRFMVNDISDSTNIGQILMSYAASFVKKKMEL